MVNKKLVGFLAIGAISVLVYGVGPGHWFQSGTAQKMPGAVVQRGPLRISVVQRGNLSAKDSVSVKSEIEGQTTILYLIPEGTITKAGDLVVELDAAELVEKKVAQEISFQNADAAYTKAKQQFEIQKSQNDSDIDAAERRVEFARLDLKKYVQGDWIQSSEKADQDILLAQQSYTQAENTLNWSKSLAEKGFLTRSELERDELSFRQAEVSLERAKRTKALLVEYDDPRRRRELEANVTESERGLERVRRQAEARLADADAGLRTSEAKLRLEKDKLDKYVMQIDKARIRAPAMGMVVYTRSDGGGRMGGGDPIQEGTQVRERQEILTIPSAGGMIAEASVHESVLKKVSVGLPCVLTIDALPGQQFDGKVQMVALLPDKGSWWANPNQRLYRTEVSVDNVHPDMRPGMSCSIEILTEQIPDTLYVPLQCVITTKGETVAFVSHGDEIEQRAVKVGRNNEKWVEIVTGLAEGEHVLLSPPPGFTPEGKGGDDKLPDGARRPMGGPGARGASSRVAGSPESAASDTSPRATDPNAAQAAPTGPRDPSAHVGAGRGDGRGSRTPGERGPKRPSPEGASVKPTDVAPAKDAAGEKDEHKTGAGDSTPAPGHMHAIESAPSQVPGSGRRP